MMKYVRINHNKDNLLSEVKENNKIRVSRDPGFRFLIEREDEIAKVNNKKNISLKESIRKQNQKIDEDRQLKSRNRFRAHRGLSPLGSIQDDKDAIFSNDIDPEGIDRIMLDESARILTDYIKLSRPLTAQLDH